MPSKTDGARDGAGSEGADGVYGVAGDELVSRDGRGKTDRRPVIQEVIVVEGKDDVAAVKRACRAEMFTTSGLGISREMIEQIRIAQKRCGVIVFTDPDSPGEKIRQIINRQVPGCKQAHLYQVRGQKGCPIGVEYAEPAEILAALESAKATINEESAVVFTMADLVKSGLTGGENAAAKRDLLARRLGLGHVNSRQLLHRLNAYGVSRREFSAVYQELNQSDA